MEVIQRVNFVGLSVGWLPYFVGKLKVFPLFLSGILQLSVRAEAWIASDFIDHLFIFVLSYILFYF